ncbi:hypothetical protein ABMY26_00375 (plasmid) [Azospirillum sp. HJ39]|uniref:hypothetical protein n=1 Tax=Azospirillum sp. HJ39 TaxID=3159496 RepID=UPI0035560B37
MARLPLTLAAALLLSGCASDQIAVKVPVVQRAEPPADLVAPIPPPGPIFSAPGTSSIACLDPAGRDALVGYVELLRKRVGAWEAWTAP